MMRTMFPRQFAVVLGLLLAACAPGARDADAPVAGSDPAAGEIFEVATGEKLTGSLELSERLALADVVILGERHDNPAHHAGQAEITRLIAARRPPAALVFEMIPPAEEPEMAELRGRGAPGSAFGPLIGWEKLGWPDWEMYAPILDAAPDAPVLGAAVPRAAVRAAMQRGAAPVFSEDLGGDAVRLGVDRSLPPDVRSAMQAEQMAAHCDALPVDVAESMVESQRLRDAAFADAVLRGRERGAGPVILITGSGHGRVDRAVPAYLRTAAPELNIISIAFKEVGNGEFQMESAPYDYLWLTEPFDRGDPCEAFRKNS